jgi:riboflavin biosynthesis pyrimidine reductase
MGVAGPDLAGNLTSPGLIDEYRLYFRPFVLGARKPYFGSDPLPLRFVATDLILGRMRLG